jgi:hypothetical protein
MSLSDRFLAVSDGIPLWQFTLRLVWIAVQVVLVICLGESGVLFFYQGF